jgi:hypothetical protein
LRSRPRFASLWDVARLRQGRGRKEADAAKIGKGFFDSRSLQPREITQNRQSVLWKSLEKTGGNLEKLGEKAWTRLYFAIFAPPGNAAAPIANWRDTLPIYIFILV